MKLNLEIVENNANFIIETEKYRTDDIIELKSSIFDKLITKNDITILNRKYFYEMSETNKNRYKTFINNVFKHHFEDYYEKGGIIVKGKWSNLNKVNTNKQVLSYTVNFLNKFILNEPFIIDNVQNDKEFEDLLVILDKNNNIYYNSTFMTGALIIIKLIEKFDLDFTTKIKEFLESKGAKVTKMGGTGDKIDMVKGLDMEFITKKGAKVRAQIKHYTGIREDENNYIISGVALPNEYDPTYIDKFLFYRVRYGKLDSIWFFENKDVKSGPAMYIIPKTSYLKYYKIN